ncbi:MAG: P-loop NTPase [Coprococcus sp.]
MSENCTHDCSSCSESCSSRTEPQSLLAKPNKESHIKKIIAVVSGKGGVGKSSVTAQLAVMMQRRGYKTAVLDADITGPSIPKAFGIKEKPENSGDNICAVTTKTGIKIMSINLLIEDEMTPVIWRGPIIAGAVKQFYTDVVWGDIDYMFVDCPPGTGDVPLTVFQSLPVDGVLVVTTPQDLVSMIVGKAVRMAESMDIPIIGMIENMSYFICPDCGKQHDIFGRSRLEDVMKELYIGKAVRLPINPDLAGLIDKGDIEDMEENDLMEFADLLADESTFYE